MIYITDSLVSTQPRAKQGTGTPKEDFNFISNYKPDKAIPREWLELEERGFQKAKLRSKYFIPGKFSKLYRADSNLEEKTLIVLDIDNTDLSYSELIYHLAEKIKQYNYCVYPTINHQEGNTRARVVIEPDRAYNKDEHTYLFYDLSDALDLEIDIGAHKWSQHQGLPIWLEGEEPSIFTNEGKPYKIKTPTKAELENIEKEKQSQDLVAVGGRNDFLISQAGKLAYTARSLEDLIANIKLVNSTALDQPLSDRELSNNILNQAKKYYDKAQKDKAQQILEEFNIETSEPIEDLEEYGSIVCLSNSYYKRQKGGIAPISTFKIQLKEVIYNDFNNEMLYKADFLNNSFNQELVFRARDLNNKNKFMDLIEHPNFMFTGSQNDLQDIKGLIARQDYRELKGVNYGGFHEHKDQRVFITQDKAINKKLDPIDDLTISEEFQVIKSHILDRQAITREELEAISPSLFTFNELKITSSLITMLPVMMMKSLLFEEKIKTQHLVLYGEAGAGKSQTVSSIIEPFFSMDQENVLSCSNVTQFSLLKSLSNTNSTPVVLEEYKPSFLSDFQRRLISDSLRNTYDCHTATRGTRDQKINSYTMLAPVILVGEEGQEETAIKERSIILNFNKEARQGRAENFYHLKENSKILNKLGYSFLEYILKADTKALVNTRTKLMDKHIDPKITEDRVRESVGNMLLGLYIITQVYKGQGLDFEKAVGLKTREIIEALNDNIFIEVLDESINTKSVVDNTIELMAIMLENNILYESDYKLINQGSELALNLSVIYPKLSKFIKDYNISTEIITNQRQFTKQLRKTRYYTDYRAVKMASNVFNDPQVNKRCYILDIEKLKEKNIEIDAFL